MLTPTSPVSEFIKHASVYVLFGLAYALSAIGMYRLRGTLSRRVWWVRTVALTLGLGFLTLDHFALHLL